MKTFHIIAVGLGLVASAVATTPNNPEIVRAGDVPKCVVANGHTIVNYSPAFHKSFKCAPKGDGCTCTVHPTHNTGGCMEIASTKSLAHGGYAGKFTQHGGDCTDSGLNPPPSNVEINDAADGAVITLPAGTHKWDNEVHCRGKTLTVLGAGKGVTIIDVARQDTPGVNGKYERRYLAHPDLNSETKGDGTIYNEYGRYDTVGSSRHFTVDAGCKLILKGVTLINGNMRQGSGAFPVGGSILVNHDGRLEATDVEFKDSYAYQWGGAVVTYLPASSASFDRCSFVNNGAAKEGGAICNYYGSSVYNDCSFTDNKSKDASGGAVYNFAGGSQRWFKYGGAPTFTGTVHFSGSKAGRKSRGNANADWGDGRFPIIDNTSNKGCAF